MFEFQIISYNDYSGPVSTPALNSKEKNKILFYSQEGKICEQQSSSYNDGMDGAAAFDCLIIII